MGHHTDSGRCATPCIVKIALDGCIVDLLFDRVLRIHQLIASHILFLFAD
ncbi:MAG: hypothetical protein GXO75_16305 [Calditrichaeota bacterium]|nr:hypothetical protein [Calditrichota bacterium]